jgi:hypothetical protein
MTHSQEVILAVRERLWDEGVPISLRDAVLTMIDEYEEAVRCALRLENTIHMLRKL